MTKQTRSAVFKGVARVIDLGGFMSRGSRRSFEADGWAIRSDWSAVGDDLYRSLSKTSDQRNRTSKGTRSSRSPKTLGNDKSGQWSTKAT